MIRKLPTQPVANTLTVRSPRGKRLVDVYEIWLFRSLLMTLVWRELKVRYRHTALGVLWYVLQPLILMLVICVGLRFAVPGGVEGLPYPLYVASGLVLWTYFVNSLPTGAGSLETYRAILDKIAFPRACLPLVFCITAIIDMLAAGLLLVPMLYYYDMLPSWRLFMLPLIVLGTGCFIYGLSLLASAASARYKDLRHLVPFFTQLMFFGSPVFISHATMPPKLATIMLANPFATYLTSFRWAIFPDAVAPSQLSVLIAVGITFFVLLVGMSYFQRQQSNLVDII